MKRATSITLLCMGAGAFFVANAYENRCGADQSQNAAVSDPDAAPQSRASCRSGGSYYSHSSGHSSGGYGVASVARGGFGAAGGRAGG
jgi:hypothetical protein